MQPQLWQVAWHVATGEVAGQVKPWSDAEQNETQHRKRGYTENISVGAPWRRRGLARALVVRALRAQKDAGMLESALGVDGESAFSAARRGCTRTAASWSRSGTCCIGSPWT